MSFICTFCAKSSEELYSGEIWIPGDYIEESWWKGEETPICVNCALDRSRETYREMHKAALLFGVI